MVCKGFRTTPCLFISEPSRRIPTGVGRNHCLGEAGSRNQQLDMLRCYTFQRLGHTLEVEMFVSFMSSSRAKSEISCGISAKIITIFSIFPAGQTYDLTCTSDRNASKYTDAYHITTRPISTLLRYFCYRLWMVASSKWRKPP